MMYQGMLVAVILTINIVPNVWLLHPCVLRWLAYYPCTLLAVRSLCNIKNITIVASLAIRMIYARCHCFLRSTAYNIFDCCVVGLHCHTLATVPHVLAMVDFCCIVVRPLTVWCKKYSCHCLLIAIQYEKHARHCCRFLQSTVCISRWWLVTRVLTIQWKFCSQCPRFLQCNIKKYALMSNGVKTQLLHEREATSQWICVNSP